VLYKRGTVWWVKIKRNRKVIRRSTETNSKTAARDFEAKLRRDLAEGRSVVARRKTFKEMTAKFITENLPKRNYPARDKSIIKNLTAFFGEDTLLKDIENSIFQYEAYRIGKGKKPATVQKELKLLGRMCNLALKKWKWLKESPLSLIDLPKVNNNRVRYLSNVEYKNLFKVLDGDAVPQWLRPMVIVSLNTGLRESNVLHMEWSWINLSSRLIFIGGEHMKNEENIGLPLTKEAFETLKGMQKAKHIAAHLVFHDNGQRIYPVKLQRAFREACKLSQIQNFHYHDLRHTFASYVRQKGVDLHTIQKLLGHKDGRMTQRYAHLSVDNLRSAISVLDKDKGAQKGAQHLTLAASDAF
jgi:integrase